MLIQFTLKNWRSVKEEQTLSLVKASGDEMADSNSFSPNAPATAQLLRSLAIYGANAAGKSNIMRGLDIMEEIVVNSASKWQPGDSIPVIPFLLDSETSKSPSEFEVIFVSNGVRYQYGFSATSERIVEEWLIAFPRGRAQRLFDRKWNDSKQMHDWDLGSSLVGKKQLWQDSTRENGLFLSTAVQLNSLQLKPVYDWFKITLRSADASGWGARFSASLCKKPEERLKILAFLKAADLDIDDVVVESEKFSSHHLIDGLAEDVKTKVLEELKEREIYKVKTVHHSLQGESISFNLDDESEGTQKLFSFAGPWIDALENGYVLFIDELHNSLHPKMVEFLVKLFNNSDTNKKNAQLVFSTHETSALDQNIFRRDQIWFCEKDRNQATQIYPLTDFSPRKGRENIESAYLAGRYGALPYLRDLKFDDGVKSGE